MTNEDKAKEIIEAAFPKLWVIKEQMDKISLLEIDLLRALYLIENIQRLSKWGKVTITIKDGEVTTVAGENTFVTDIELQRNLSKYQNR